MCVDDGYLLPALVTLGSVADHLPVADRRECAVRVLTDGLSPGRAAVMAAFARRCGFGSFDLRRQAPPAESVMADTAYISITTYLRFGFTPGFLDRPFLIYVDADVLVRGDLSTPLDELSSDRIGAVQDEFNPAVGQCPALPGVADRWPHLTGRPYFNAGMLWAPTGMLAPMRAGVQRALVGGRKYIKHNDQCALNLWLLSSGAAHPVGPAFNRFEVDRFLERGDWVRRVLRRPVTRRDARVVHFVGAQKPWMRSCPRTEDVRDYRLQMHRTLRHLGRAGTR
ncbi:glycosyltransferase family 8 protein [Streptomyces erythrochromogenes]|uniref:glycosyltransferase family 8 protein n=1 Tax=Streptomyces erythrochromogenes TaxID=285574 RepID=UPI0037FAFDA1